MAKIEQKTRTVKINKSFLLELAEDDRLNKKDFRLILYLLTELDDVEFVRITQKQVCVDLFLEKSVVSKSFASLISLGILEEGVTENFEKGYRFRWLPRLIDQIRR
ncbi:hypothetical protein BAG01nite_45280 [Brevibacillus agri]|uniref:MarR family transcriptional regulator n=1 Tax=Brevibacillus agri TaxID=51101 RepID=A0A3M8A561_9BACL|nr:hypothetical protein [Brevibacillus agri]ELK39637.1 hypothetical protein D478_23343 [Brevibacillus agri BAB-2500]MBY0055020.1 hypothetical protein [Brevibacillus agri]QAV11866.1 hypothetical protein BA6348_03310 [Brevibacillus agri]RNB46353.1 hypothetical protein EB820_25105 [Brevibacillus agri]GED28426.1 hypothetical protein BAG01nite_45280 [Brevibacillus agri]